MTPTTRRRGPTRIVTALWLGVLGGALLGLLTVTPAVAAPAWLAPTNLSVGNEDGEDPQVAAGPQGEAIAIWESYDGSGTTIETASRPPGGSWSTPTQLTAPGLDAYNPEIAIGPQGEAIAIWARVDGGKPLIQVATRAVDGGWSAATNLSAPGQQADRPQVAIDAQGNAIAAWERSDGSHYIVQAATRPAGGSWSAPAGLSAAGQNATNPMLAVNPEGEAITVWERYSGSHFVVQVATRHAGGGWSAATNLSAAAKDGTRPQVALDPRGDAVVLWRSGDGSDLVVETASRPPGGSWSAPAELTAPGLDAYAPRIAVDAQGNAIAAWERFDGSHYIVQAATRPAGGTWSVPASLSAPGHDAGRPAIGVDAVGSAIVAWSRSDGSHYIVQAAARPPAGTWSAPVDLSGPGEDAYAPQLATDLWGDAVAVWEGDDGSHSIVQAAGYDATGPQLAGLSIPAQGRAGVPVPFSVSPLDVWSGLGGTSWSFGDGAAGAGAGVEHAYARAGTYQVTVTAADSLGNPTSTAAAIAIIAGRAYAAPFAEVRRGRARLKLRCRAGNCAGFIKLTARKLPRRPGRGRGAKVGRIALGGSAFAIANGKVKVIRVKLHGGAGKLIGAAGRKGLRVRLGGSGVKGRAVMLRPTAKFRRGHRSRRGGNRSGGKRWVFSTR